MMKERLVSLFVLNFFKCPQSHPYDICPFLDFVNLFSALLLFLKTLLSTVLDAISSSIMSSSVSDSKQKGKVKDADLGSSMIDGK